MKRQFKGAQYSSRVEVKGILIIKVKIQED